MERDEWMDNGVHGNATGTWGFLAGFVGLAGPLLLFYFHFLSSSSSAYSSSLRPSSTCSDAHLLRGRFSHCYLLLV